jgi:hypothetical protein
MDPELLRMLKEAGVTWRLEDKKRHKALRINGLVVLILPRDEGRCVGRTVDNARATVRRHLRGLKP